uniref:Uncharacterized protein n=1 Tax=Arundo donax TaxID=35708 RepID=A0A0A9G676_ARUDO
MMHEPGRNQYSYMNVIMLAHTSVRTCHCTHLILH